MTGVVLGHIYNYGLNSTTDETGTAKIFLIKKIISSNFTNKLCKPKLV